MFFIIHWHIATHNKTTNDIWNANWNVGNADFASAMTRNRYYGYLKHWCGVSGEGLFEIHTLHTTKNTHGIQ